jgi:hypothetical protein
MNKNTSKKILALRLGVIFLHIAAQFSRAITFWYPEPLTTSSAITHPTHSHPFLTMAGSSTKSTQTMEDTITNMCAQIVKLVTTIATIQANQETLQGDQSRLTMAVTHLQSNKIGDSDSSGMAAHHGQTMPTDNTDAIAHAAKHGHKLLFPTYDGTEDPLLWLNKCDHFFRIQETPEVGKVFLVTFYMSGEASQWSTLLERIQGKPSWEEFVHLIDQRFSPPL